MTEFLDDKIVKLFEERTDSVAFVKGFNTLIDEWCGGKMDLIQLKRANNLINLALDRIEKEHGIRLMKKNAYYDQVMKNLG